MTMKITESILIWMAPIVTPICEKSLPVFNVVKRIVDGWQASSLTFSRKQFDRKRFLWYLKTMKPILNRPCNRVRTQPTWQF